VIIVSESEQETSDLVEKRESAVHGTGLYATTDIAKDEWIIEYVGEKIDKAESERRCLAQLEEAAQTGGAAVYMFTLDDEWDLDGSGEDNVARLINHSCEPNCEAQIWKDREIWVTALKDIQEGEELSFNYGFDLDNYRDHPCRCGSDRCVGYIAAEDYWPELKKKLAKKKAARKKAAAKRKKSRKKSGKS